MHPHPAFRQSPRDRNIGFARERAFGVLAVNGAEGPLLSHVPFLLTEDGVTADLHLVRSNPIVRALATPQPAVIAVSGPDGYISPDWYDMADQVPTWNYLAVHLRGTLELLPEGDMHDMLDRQSAHFEDQLRPKKPWTMGKMPEDVLARMMRQIVPARLTVAVVDGTWKLNQNKTDEARERAAGFVTESGIGMEQDVLAGLMRGAKG
ncbi:MAG: FMN-binding negative transcriptional regulator [Rhodobacterales bacterium]|nr:FMN-binding negative transcriptional regulator [Rhodobacterales bacterium]